MKLIISLLTTLTVSILTVTASPPASAVTVFDGQSVEDLRARLAAESDMPIGSSHIQTLQKVITSTTTSLGPNISVTSEAETLPPFEESDFYKVVGRERVYDRNYTPLTSKNSPVYKVGDFHIVCPGNTIRYSADSAGHCLCRIKQEQLKHKVVTSVPVNIGRTLKNYPLRPTIGIGKVISMNFKEAVRQGFTNLNYQDEYEIQKKITVHPITLLAGTEQVAAYMEEAWRHGGLGVSIEVVALTETEYFIISAQLERFVN
ncbi:hypothetical protein ACWJJH_02855 [Endozoicomonadaceae bacterium StTr2]